MSADPAVLDRLQGDEPVWVVDPVDGTSALRPGRPGLLHPGHPGPRRSAACLLDVRAAARPVGHRPPRRGRLAERRATAHGHRAASRCGSSISNPVLPRRRGARRGRPGSTAGTECVPCVTSAGLEYLKVARGLLDAVAFYWETPWDHAAGLLLVAEAGGASADGRPGSRSGSPAATRCRSPRRGTRRPHGGSWTCWRRRLTSGAVLRMSETDVPSMVDAVVVGPGPNGLTAAVELARARPVRCRSSRPPTTIGGGARTEELTLPGFRHDPCSAVHPLGVGSPAFNAMPLGRHGLEWLHPELPMAHPFPDGTAAVLARSVGETATSLGPRDAGTYRGWSPRTLGHWDTLAARLAARPVGRAAPRPATCARFGLTGLPPVAAAGPPLPRREGARAVRRPGRRTPSPRSAAVGTGAMALIFALAAHEGGWPVAARRLAGDLRRARRRTCASWAARSTPASRSSGSTNCRPPARTSSTPRRPRWPGSPALGDAYRGLPLRARRLQDRLRAGRPRAVDRAGRPPRRHRAHRPHRHRDRRRPAAGRGERPAAADPFLITAQPSLVDPSRAPGGQARLLGLRPRARTAGTATPPTPSSGRSSASRPASATWCWPAPSPARPSSPPATPTTSAATSPAAPSPDSRPCSAPSSPASRTPPPHPAVFLCSVGHPARPRRARHVRPQRGEGRPAPPARPAPGALNARRPRSASAGSGASPRGRST